MNTNKIREITFRVSKVLKTEIKRAAFLNEQFVTSEIDNFVADQADVSSIINQVRSYFGSSRLSDQLIDNRIRVIVSNPVDIFPTTFEFFVEKVTTERAQLVSEVHPTNAARLSA